MIADNQPTGISHKMPLEPPPAVESRCTGGGSIAGKRGLRILLFWILPAAVFGFYARSVNYDFIYDDVILIKDQKAPRNLREFARLFAEPHYPNLPYYRPLTRLTLLAQKRIHGDRPGLFHLANAALMSLTSVIACLILRGPPFRTAPGVASVAVALFSLHPAASSVVFPITGRETLLTALFMFAALLFFFKAGRWSRLATFSMFVLALFSKEQAVVLPLMFILGDLLALPADAPGKDWRKWLIYYGAYPPVLLAYFAIRARLFHSGEVILQLTEKPWDLPLSYLYTVQTIFLPSRHLLYEPSLRTWFAPAKLLLALSFLAILIAAGIYMRKELGHRLLFWAGGFVLLQLATANILRQETPFDERYIFAAMFSIFAASALVAGRLQDRRFRVYIVAPLSLALLAYYLWAGAVRGSEFRDSYHFFKQWQETEPASYIARTNFAVVLLRRRDPGARSHLEAALSIRMGEEALITLGSLSLEEGKNEEALALLREAVNLYPGSFASHDSLAYAAEKTGNPRMAEEHYRASVTIAPGRAASRINLAGFLARAGRLPEAVEQLEIARRLEPDNISILKDLGNAYADLGMPIEAREVLRDARRLSPGERLSSPGD